MKITKRQLRRLISESINNVIGTIPFDQNLKFKMPSKAPNSAAYAQVTNNRDGSPELIYFLDINKQPIQGGINIKALANYVINPSRVNDALSDINIFVLNNLGLINSNMGKTKSKMFKNGTKNAQKGKTL